MSGRYNQRLERKIATDFNGGEELHILTQDAKGKRILNLRLYREAPSQDGRTGYTKKGFYLYREEAIQLRDALNDLLADGAFDTNDTQEIPETLEG